ncbi:radical SAM protein [Marichromatium gracile]|nr:radical SAM protein [Marichromatium gracile]
MDASNPFLSRLMAKIREPRLPLPPDQPFFNRIERVPAGLYGELWFRTAGCRWDRQGGCTMCNYGQSEPPHPDAMVDAVRQALHALEQPVDELMVSPSGSLLDPAEVPEEVRRRIYALMAAHPASQLLLETRSEWVTPETADELRAIRPLECGITVEMGLESADPWVRRFCINKGGSLADFARAAGLLRERGLGIYANVCLGTAFLSSAEAIDDAVATVRWALDNGADRTVVFPVHIKSYTLLEVLSRDGSYAAPSLWSLVEVLRRLGPTLAGRVEIAWYRSYYDREGKITRSPDTCPHCRAAVIGLLDDYRASQNHGTVEMLSAYPCSCRDAWAKSLAVPHGERADRVAAAYRSLANAFGLDDWLAANGGNLMAALYASGRKGD